MGSSVFGLFYTGSLAGGAPTPKSRDLAEDERLQLGELVAPSQSMRVDDLPDCWFRLFSCLRAFVL